MKICKRVHEDMVTEFVETLPRFCLYCGSRCWPDGHYPYACRCSQCSSYFHRTFNTCEDIDFGGLGLDSYHTCSDAAALRLVELYDGTLFEVCPNCVELLREEGFTSEDTSFSDSAIVNSDRRVRT